MKLHDAPGAPSPRRVRIFLAEKGVQVERVPVDLAARAQYEPEFVELNPRCTVPVLELDDGTCLCDSVAICRYLEAAYPEPPLYGATAVESGLVTDWDRRAELEGYFAVADLVRNTSPRFEGRAVTGWIAGIPQIPALADRSRKVLARLLRDADRALDRRAYLALDRFTAADITLLVALDFAARAGLDPLDGHPAVADWHARVSARASASA